MASCFTYSFLSAVGRIAIFPTNRNVAKRSSTMLTTLLTNANSKISTPNTCRTIWTLSNLANSHVNLMKSKGVQAVGFGRPCSSQNTHTEVDQDLSEFLSKEIKYERETGKSSTVPTVQGFTVTSDGSDVTMIKQGDSETITVKLNVNNTVDADSPPELETQDESELATMVCKPPFIVEIKKSGGQILAFQCSFPPAEDVMEKELQGEQQNEDAVEDMFDIDEVAIFEGEWTEKSYSLSSAVMDGDMYDLLMDFLDDRGINNNFASQMVEYSTAFEHSKYLKFLENVKSFVGKK